MIFRPYNCFYCHRDMNEGYPTEDEEPQFCCKECRNKYILENGKLPLGIIKNFKY